MNPADDFFHNNDVNKNNRTPIDTLGPDLLVAQQQAQLPLVMDYPPVKAVPTLRKPVPVVHIYPVNGEYDLYTRRVFNVLLVETYKTWSTLSVETQDQYLDERRVLRFRSKVSDIRKQLGNASKSNRRVVQAVRRLYRLEFRFDVMGESGGIWKMDSRLLSQVGRRSSAVTVDGESVPAIIEEEDEELVKEICWEFPPDVFAMLVSHRVYAAIDLSLANSWRSQFTLALYENTYRYRNNPTRLTARLPVEQWMNLIGNGSPALARYKAPGGYRYFKREMLKPAIDEMTSSEVCPITVEPIEDRSGKRIATLQFRVIDKQAKSNLGRELAELQPRNPELVQKLRAFGVDEDAIKKVLCGAEDDILRAIRITEKALEKGGVGSAAGFFISALQRQFQEVESVEDVVARKQKGLEAELRQKASREDLEMAYHKHRGARTRDYFAQLLPVMQEALITSFLANDESKPVRALYASKGMENPRFQGSFHNWLARQEGILTKPEEQSLEAFEAWRGASRAVKPGKSKVRAASA